jgi:hypothetical protein
MEETNAKGVKRADELVVTRLLSVENALYILAVKGVSQNKLKLLYVPGKKQEQTAQMLLYLLSHSFGWYETDREIQVQDLQGVDMKTGAPIFYKSEVTVVTIEKHGAIRTD